MFNIIILNNIKYKLITATLDHTFDPTLGSTFGGS